MKYKRFEFIDRSCETDRVVFDEMFKYDTYRWFEKPIKGGFIIDIGANIGTFSIPVSVHNTVLSYEPEENNFLTFKQNIELNKSNISAINKAIGIPGSYIIENQGGGSRLREDGFGNEIKAISINDIIKKDVDFLKMDCEGSEFMIIEDATAKTLNRIKKMAIEVHPDLTDKETFKKFMDKLDKYFDLEITGGIPNGYGGILFCNIKK